MTGEDSTKDIPLSVRPGETRPLPRSGRVMECEGFHAAYHAGGRVFRRYSPMAVRLALLCGRELTQAASVSGRQ